MGIYGANIYLTITNFCAALKEADVIRNYINATRQSGKVEKFSDHQIWRLYKCGGSRRGYR